MSQPLPHHTTPRLDPTPEPITIRELTGADADHVIGVFESLSDQDRHFRFFRPMPTYPPAVLRFLVGFDGWDHVAVGAFAGAAGRPSCLGVARYVRHARRPGVAELALSVTPTARRRGVATGLVDHLDQIAGRRGIEELEINVHPENRRASALFRSIGFRTRFDDGTVVGSRPVAAAPDATADAIGRELLAA